MEAPTSHILYEHLQKPPPQLNGIFGSMSSPLDSVGVLHAAMPSPVVESYRIGYFALDALSGLALHQLSGFLAMDYKNETNIKT